MQSRSGFSLWKPTYELWIKCKMQHFYYEPWLKSIVPIEHSGPLHFRTPKITGLLFLSSIKSKKLQISNTCRALFGIFWPFIENSVVAYKLLLLAMVPAVWHSIWKYGTWLFLQGNPFNLVQRISIVLRRSRERELMQQKYDWEGRQHEKLEKLAALSVLRWCGKIFLTFIICLLLQKASTIVVVGPLTKTLWSFNWIISSK